MCQELLLALYSYELIDPLNNQLEWSLLLSLLYKHEDR